jgi:hypothetical protein
MKPLKAILTLTVLFVLGSVGCAPPDRWPLFDHGVEAGISEIDPPSSPHWEEARPRFMDPPAVEMSDRGSIDLSVEQAALLALQNNPELKVRQANPVITATFEEIERGV